ncbi:surface-adhesin E family protein [uncultured Nitrosomonas sp.]|uniref:surface-adhesin E family protein n=1 Tax=uncultured Nitrosomonas sp. TaxID=156424 RepID=UPI0025FFBCF3|nr:surface-adhesin E family protein [uncultured Nitrosomonas sp.]
MKNLLFFFLIFSLNPAWAEWSRTGNIENKTMYVDLMSIKKNEHFARVWQLIDNVNDEKLPSITSIKSLYEYDCKESRRRLISEDFFSNRMGLGNIIYKNNDLNKWLYFRLQDHNNMSIVYSLVCNGEWQKIEIADNSNVRDFYYDPSTIRKNVQFVMFWTLINFVQKDQTGARSAKHLHEYDCLSSRHRTIGQTTHSDFNALGDVVSSALGAPIFDWEQAEIDPHKFLLAIVCD